MSRFIQRFGKQDLAGVKRLEPGFGGHKQGDRLTRLFDRLKQPGPARETPLFP
jgi:hypothetical protein